MILQRNRESVRVGRKMEKSREKRRWNDVNKKGERGPDTALVYKANHRKGKRGKRKAGASLKGKKESAVSWINRKKGSRMMNKGEAGVKDPLRRDGRSTEQEALLAEEEDLGRETLDAAYHAGEKIAEQEMESLMSAFDYGRKEGERKVNQLWVDFLRGLPRKPSWGKYHPLASAFMRGITDRGIPIREGFLPFPTVSAVTAILSIKNEGKTLPSLLRELDRLPFHQVIAVVNGSTDDSLQIVRSMTDVTVLEYKGALGHDVGRAVGAASSRGQILLFLDADILLPAESLLPFIGAVAEGADVALNNLTPYFPPFHLRDRITILKEFLNRVMGRNDLHANSLTAVPHALSRKALEVIGIENLMVPPKAHALALYHPLKVICPYSVDVVSQNRLRKENTGFLNRVEELITGDYIEAIDTLIRLKGGRLGYNDTGRRTPDAQREVV